MSFAGVFCGIVLGKPKKTIQSPRAVPGFPFEDASILSIFANLPVMIVFN